MRTRCLWIDVSTLSALVFTCSLGGNFLPAQDLVQIGSFDVPVHRIPGAGVWASRDSYKVRFETGFEFHPVVGATRPSLPWSWQTESVTVGELELAPDGAAMRTSDWRVEYDYGSVLEVYDVLEAGVEQSFVIHQRPVSAGDLVIRGRITSVLESAQLEPRHASLIFRHAGEAIIEYGHAWAIDADGRRTAMSTSFDGQCIELRLAAADVARAAFPLVVDPLTSAVNIKGSINTNVASTAIAVEVDHANPRLLTCVTRAVSSTDADGFAYVTNRDFGNASTIWSEIAQWNTSRVVCCFVGSSSHWVLGVQRTTSGGERIHTYVHDSRSLAFMSGTRVFITPPAGREQKNPSLGGQAHALHALLAYEDWPAASATPSYAIAVRIEPATRVASPPLTLWTATGARNIRNPAVTPVADGLNNWVVVCSQPESTSSRSYLWAHAVSAAGNHSTGVSIRRAASGATMSQPKIAGSNNRYLVTYVKTGPGLGSEVHALSFDWDVSRAPRVRSDRVITSSFIGITNGGLARDRVTNSHWAMSYSQRLFSGNGSSAHVLRLGYNGGVTESQSLHGTASAWPRHPSVAFARRDNRFEFQVVYSLRTLFRPAVGRQFQYPADALNVPYGLGCAQASVIVETSPPYAGTEQFRHALLGAQPNSPAFYLLSSGPAQIDLTGIGMTNCFLNIFAPVVLSIPTPTNAAGRAEIKFPLPDLPVFVGDLYSQWFYVAPSANALGILSMKGIRHQVR